MMGPNDIASVAMTRRNWCAITAMLIEHIDDMLSERDTTFGEDREDLEQAIRDHLQKMLPLLHHAADKSEYPEITEAFKNIQKRAGLIIPENIEDAVKELVIFVPRDQ